MWRRSLRTGGYVRALHALKEKNGDALGIRRGLNGLHNSRLTDQRSHPLASSYLDEAHGSEGKLLQQMLVGSMVRTSNKSITIYSATALRFTSVGRISHR
ncbi:hypothetical protein V6N13_127786 [Hibiscus sabdariffa]|uniref:Uncharacterized protein n=1 Tax=Hibiscus sabdariffa TaxID=183260 RepID=A0ABR2CDP9_9ROSI